MFVIFSRQCLQSHVYLLFSEHAICTEQTTDELTASKQRPDIIAPIMTVELTKPELQSPGYYFLGVYQAEQSGPYIYDNAGVCLSRPPLRSY